MTLRFLGDVDEAAVPALASASPPRCAGAAPSSCRWAGAVMAFPSLRRPRVVALDVAPHPPVEALAEASSAASWTAGFDAEERPFRPHLTLGRVRRGRRAPAIDTSVAPSRPRRSDGRFTTSCSSAATSARAARYTALERVPLALGANASPPSQPFER